MTKKEIINTALKGVGMARVQGDTTEPVMPYLLADIMYQLYQKYVNPNKLKHKLKQMHSSWQKTYKKFNIPVFSEFKPEEYVELTDMMDSVTEYLSNEITMLRSNIMNVISDIDSFEDKMVVSTFIMCHIFAQYAECSYERVYYKTRNLYFGTIEEPASCSELCYLRDLSYKMAFQYIKLIPGGELYIDDYDMQNMFNVIARKIYKWLEKN